MNNIMEYKGYIAMIKYSDEDEYFNLLFTYIISLKEENAKLIDKLNEFGI